MPGVPTIVPAEKLLAFVDVDRTPDSLGEAQEVFALDISWLIRVMYDQDYRVRIGAVHRTPEAQNAEYRARRSKLDGYNGISRHQQKLAADLFLVKREGGVWKVSWEFEDYKPFGEIWEKRDPANVWGGNWPTLRDAVHFERKPPEEA